MTGIPSASAPVLLTIPEAGRKLGVGRDTIYRLVSRGEIERVHVLAGSRITVDSLDRYVERIRRSV
jgi:excisionase family DNA binding protein